MTPSPEILPILSVRHLSTGYGKKQVLFDVSLDVMPGEIILITGGNGSGKSTLLKAIYGLIAPWNDDAEILYRPNQSGSAIGTSIASNNLAQGLAYLPQKNAVFDDLTVEDNLRLAGHILNDGKEFVSRHNEVLTSLPTITPLLKRRPEQLSGGERQLVALGMVLLHRPKLLLLDEPTAGLDFDNLQLLLGVICKIKQRHGLACVIVEHRLAGFAAMGGRTLFLRLGVIEEHVAWQEKIGEGHATLLT